MAMSIDTFIENLTTVATRTGDMASTFAHNAQVAAAGETSSVPVSAVNYITAGAFQSLDVTGPEFGSVTNAITNALSAFQDLYDTHFQAETDEYAQWMNGMMEYMDEEPVTSDLQAKLDALTLMDAAEGERNKRAMRAESANRGFAKAPGVLVGRVLDDIDMRTERLAQARMAALNDASTEYIAAKKALIERAMTTQQSKTAAINALSSLIATAAASYSTEADKAVATLQKRRNAAAMLIDYYKAEQEVDALNVRIHKFNAGANVSRYSVNGELFYRNEQAKSRAALARAEQAANIAKAAYQSLNAIASAATVTF